MADEKDVSAAESSDDGLRQTDDQPEGAGVGRLHAPILREKQLPRDGYEPVPLWLVASLGVLLFWGGWYLANFSGGWDANILDPDPAVRYAARVAEPEGPIDPMVLGERVFTQRCSSCHTPTGQGQPGVYPTLVGSPWVLENQQRLMRIVLNGLAGPILVLGEVYDGNMPAFARQLNDEQSAAVLTYVRGSWGNDAGPISAESVAETRALVADRSTAWSSDELAAIDAPD